MSPAATNKIRSAAQQLREKRLGPSSVRATPVIDIAEDLGFVVVEFTPNQETRNISGAVNYQKKVIYINAEEAAIRKRFTIAHEIGHIQLHKNDESDDEEGFVDYRGQWEPGYADAPKEREANTFAAELLMPKEAFESLWNAFDGKLETIADHFRVSEVSARIRAKELGLRR